MSGEGPSRAAVAGILTVSILAVSTAAILVRLSTAGPVALSFWRLAIASGLILPLAVRRNRGTLRDLTRRDAAGLAAVGVVLAVHFASWIASLSYTTVAASVVLVTTHPVLVGLASARLFDEALPRAGWAGVALALAGAALIAVGDSRLAGHALLGDALAALGAAAMAVYLLAGRSYRQRLPVLPYTGLVYGAAALALLPAVVGGPDALLDHPPRDYAIFVALALVPMIFGHTLLNYALEHVPAPVVSTSILGEPVGSTILAFLILGEVPPLLTLAGGLVVLAGIGLVARQGVGPGPDGPGAEAPAGG